MSSELDDSVAAGASAHLAFSDALSLVDDGRWQEAIDRLSAAREYLQDPATRASLAREQAGVAIDARRPHDAREAARVALDDEIAASGAASAESLLTLGYGLDDCGEQAEALTVYRSARQMLWDRGDRAGVANADMNIALALRGTGQRDEGLELLQDVHTRMQELGDDYQLRTCEHNLVSALSHTERFDEALEMAEVVLEKQRATGSQRDVADAIYQRSNIHNSLGRVEEARAGYIESMETYRRINLPTEVADCIDALGTIARIDGLFDFAIAMHGEAIRVYQEGRLKIEESIARYQLAKTLLRAGRFEAAVTEGLAATGVPGSDMDGRVIAAAALDRLGRSEEGEALRQQFADRWGESMLDREISWADRQ